jgi:argininosuccinate lyase
VSRLWGGRFEAGLAPEALAFTRSASFDRRLVREDCRVLAAHAAALAGGGILSRAEAGAVATALTQIAEDVASGAFPVLPEDEDVHSTVERALLERMPEVAPKVRAGLSRNDRVATALRLWMLDALTRVRRHLRDLIGALVERAASEVWTVMPGYTHLQRAQPVTLGFHLLGHAHALRRDVQRLDDAAGRCRGLPLGAGALAGSTLPLDPAAGEALGLGGRMQALDAVSARDFAAEFLAAAAILGAHCSRLAEEIVLWTTTEFGFAELHDAYATGSSLMPQKKNPDVAELARAKAGRLIGNLAGLLATMKGLPLAYNRDLQEDKEPVFDSADALDAALPALAGAVRTIRFERARMRSAATDPLLLATDLAEHLVTKGVPFAEAHEAVGNAVRSSIETGRDWRAMTIEEWQVFSPRFDAGVARVLDVDSSVRQRLGGIEADLEEMAAWVASQAGERP